MTMTIAAGCETMTGKSPGRHFSDKWMAKEAKYRLAAQKFRNLTALHVEANQGTLYLTGNVETPEDRAKAEQIAWDVDGVRNVVNNIQVETTSTAQRRPTSTVAVPAESSTREATAASPSASPAGSPALRHTVTGEVVDVDHATGRLTVKDGGDNLVLQFPPSAVRNVKAGDHVTVQLALSPAP